MEKMTTMMFTDIFLGRRLALLLSINNFCCFSGDNGKFSNEFNLSKAFRICLIGGSLCVTVSGCTVYVHFIAAQKLRASYVSVIASRAIVAQMEFSSINYFIIFSREPKILSSPY